MVVLADAKVAYPSPQVLPQFVQPVRHGHPPASARQLLDPVLEVRLGLFSPAYLLALDRKAQEAAFAHQGYFAFGKVDVKFEGALQIPCQAAHDPLTRTFGLDQNNQREWPALGCTHFAGFDVPTDQHPGAQVTPNQS